MNITEPSNFDALMWYIDHEFPETHRKRKASNRDVLFYALRVIKYGLPWKEIKKSFRSINDSKTGRAVGVFYTAWTDAVCRYANERFRKDPKAFSAIFVDCTRIKNFEVIECAGPNSTDRGRSGTKISVNHKLIYRNFETFFRAYVCIKVVVGVRCIKTLQMVHSRDVEKNVQCAVLP